jgi:hypothetical protein
MQDTDVIYATIDTTHEDLIRLTIYHGLGKIDALCNPGEFE